MSSIMAVAHLKSKSPYGQSKYYSKEMVPANGNETSADYEKRTWRNRMHVNEDGNVFIPPMSIKLALNGAAKYLSMGIPGQGKKTYTKKFESGIMVIDPIVLPVKVSEVEGVWLHLPADGMPGGNRRVEKCFGCIPQWQGKAIIHVLDNIITEEVLAAHLEAAGNYIGLGFFRPERRGYWGRFDVTKIEYDI